MRTDFLVLAALIAKDSEPFVNALKLKHADPELVDLTEAAALTPSCSASLDRLLHAESNSADVYA